MRALQYACVRLERFGRKNLQDRQAPLSSFDQRLKSRWIGSFPAQYAGKPGESSHDSAERPQLLPTGSSDYSYSSCPDRVLLSRFWIPSLNARRPDNMEMISSHNLLMKCGFYASRLSGVFHMLPLGLRVQEKLERLIDKHMRVLGASKLALSTFSSDSLWRRTGRLAKAGPEIFRVEDRQMSELILSPTHEEEITDLAKGLIRSYKELPLRLYQISRKYRDERRPRDGLLRAKEFLMKDLYTFDWSEDLANETYKQVTRAYTAFFHELKIPILRAKAASGTMGGISSHEYHLRSSIGEDEVVSCSNCRYAANAELAEAGGMSVQTRSPLLRVRTDTWNDVLANSDNFGSSFSREYFFAPKEKILYIIFLQSSGDVSRPSQANTYTLKQSHGVETSIRLSQFQVQELCLQGIKNAYPGPLLEIVWILDKYIDYSGSDRLDTCLDGYPMIVRVKKSDRALRRIQSGDSCPNPGCDSGTLTVQSCVELGHTFDLGARYSSSLDAEIDIPTMPPSRAPFHMGCHGIGISRLIAGVADWLRDNKGLNWPRAIAPFEVIILPAMNRRSEAMEVYDILTNQSSQFDCIVDDREASFGSKIVDAELIGYPVIVTVGRGWQLGSKACLVQCRRPYEYKAEVPLQELKVTIQDLLEQI